MSGESVEALRNSGHKRLNEVLDYINDHTMHLYLKHYKLKKVDDIVNRTVLSLCSTLFKVESPVRRLMQHLLSRVIVYGVTVPGTLLDRVVSIGESPTKRVFSSQYVPKTSVSK